MREELNITTERFARQSRDRHPFTEDAPQRSWAHYAYFAGVAFAIAFGLFALFYSRSTP